MSSVKLRYDPTLPPRLKATQNWFAGIISRPMDQNGNIQHTSPSGNAIAEEACDYLASGPTLKAHQRIEIYNQQYWWRLTKILHENCPMLTRIFGYTAFNQTIAIPYLTKYPPNHWSLYRLSERLSRWIQESYKGSQQTLTLQAAEIDWAYLRGFMAPNWPELARAADPIALERMLDQTLYLQPHLTLWKHSQQLFSLRDILLSREDADYWIDHVIPPTPSQGPYHSVLWRNRHQNMEWMQITHSAYQFLSQFHDGRSINRVLTWVERQPSALADEVAIQLSTWLTQWISNGWFASKREPSTSS